MMELAAPLSPQDCSQIAESFRQDAIQVLESAEQAKQNGNYQWMLCLCQHAERYLDLMDIFKTGDQNAL